jgi:hypothetical protein
MCSDWPHENGVNPSLWATIFGTRGSRQPQVGSAPEVTANSFQQLSISEVVEESEWTPQALYRLVLPPNPYVGMPVCSLSTLEYRLVFADLRHFWPQCPRVVSTALAVHNLQ